MPDSDISSDEEVYEVNVESDVSVTSDNEAEHEIRSLVVKCAEFETEVRTSIDWTITGVKKLAKNSVIGRSLESPPFRIGFEEDTVCSIRLYPRGTCTNDEDSLGIFLKISERCRPLFVNYKFILDNIKTQFFTPVSTERKVEPGKSYGSSNLLSTKNFVNMVKDDTLTIKFTVSAYLTSKIDQGSRKAHEIISSLWKATDNSDFSISIQDELIPVHTFVLKNHSPVFQAIFKTICLEKKTIHNRD
ncbi:hypothetical protein QAD02_018756 [Eretmocerus hayati]|uniref:Uncharacterized protein n=1 Tax=Eretmocerus hayati TaxID=131215 RepID=A0ACC2PI08_9HYME|nr:hypothetical protein QAD02_018756 [Eretmocerus hayati]